MGILDPKPITPAGLDTAVEQAVKTKGSKTEAALTATYGDVVFAKQFGVVADGVTDDTASAQAALDAAGVGDVVVFPRGTTKITAPIYFGSGITIRGSIGAQITQATSGQPALVSKSYNATTYGGGPSGHTVVRDLRVNVPAAAGSHGIIMRDYYSRIENVQVAGGDKAFWLTAKNDAGTAVGSTLVENRISGCKATGYVGYGFYAGDADNNKLTDGYLIDCLASGATGSTAHVFIGSSAGWQVRGVHTYGLTTGHSIHLHAAFQTIVDGIYVETWTSAGVALTSAQQAVTLSNLSLRAPGATSNGAVYITRSGAFASLNVLATNVQVTQNNAAAVTAFNVISSGIALNVSGYAANGTQAAQVVFSNVAATALAARERVINVLDYGAVGDWNGIAGTDNLAAFDKAAAAAKASGKPATIYIPAGDYRLSNNWLLDGENIRVECDPKAVVRTTAATTTGGAVAFMGNGVLSPNNVSAPQRESFSWRGGKISATGSGTADNALGVVRVKNCHVSDVRLDADRKALTSQYGIDNIVWERIVVERAGVDAVAVETATHRAVLRDIHIVSAGKIGVTVTSAFADQRNSDVLIDNVHVDASETGYSLGLTDRVSLRKVTSSNASLRDLYVAEVTDLSISGDSRLTVATYGANVTHKRPPAVAITLNAALAIPWVPFGAPYDDPRVRRTADGMVVMSGAIKSGTATSSSRIGTVPVGYRPPFRCRMAAISGGTTPADIYVDTDGGIFLANNTASTIIAFDGLVFPAA